MNSTLGFLGPMANWPQVSAIEGVGQALNDISISHRLVLATNASDSNSDQVKSALKRVDLDSYFEQVLTYHELGSRKPQRDFFRNIEQIIKEKSENFIMVGDDFQTDILGAHQAGWKSIWFNPEIRFSSSLLAVHSAEIYQMRELSNVLHSEFLPDWLTCQMWYQEKSASLRLWLHVQLVGGVAYALAILLKRKGMEINPMLAQRGGLMHDICKLDSVDEENPEMDHGQLGSAWLMSRGQTKLAKISEKHVLDAILSSNRHPITWEEKVVYYADKLCEEASLVSLDTRIKRLQKKYPSHSEKIENSIYEMKKLQHEISCCLDMTEEDMLDNIRQTINHS